MLKQRHLLRLLLATITVAAAGASAVSGSLWIACGMIVCALALGALPLAKRVSQVDVKALLEALRDARQDGAPAVKAVVGTMLMFIGKSAMSGQPVRGTALLFRDEIEDLAWRELATLLRHQEHSSPELKKVDHHASLALGKLSDL